MSIFDDEVEAPIDAVARLRSTLARGQSRKVKGNDEKMLAKATGHAWFKSQRPTLVGRVSEGVLAPIDSQFTKLLEYSDRETTRRKYLDLLLLIKQGLVHVRSEALLTRDSRSPTKPDFGGLIGEARMLSIVNRRWEETLVCIAAGAHLAATVMMGGLLEALLLARVNRLTDLKPVFTARLAPRDKQGRTLMLKDWGLKNYLDVANELGWIRQSAKDVGAVLRDYRNYVHPEKELAHAVALDERDTAMFLSLFCSIADQVIESA